MKGFLGLFFIACIGTLMSAQDALNMNLLGHWDDPNLIFSGGQKYNDCWGYEADGREYAIMGSIRKVHFLDITDPSNIVEVATIESSNPVNSFWRDFKTFGHYAYGVVDVGTTEGMMVFDLSDLPNSVTLVNEITDGFQRCHNIFIDTLHGRLYAAGTNTRSNGLIVYDLNNDPVNPEIIGDAQLLGGYVHDLHVRDHIAYCSQGTNSGLRVHDMTNPQIPNQLGVLSGYIDAGYNHSSWPTADASHLVMCDENFGRSVKMVNASDFSNMFVTDTFKSTLEFPVASNSIAHNPFILGDYVYISYYHDGLQVYDISDPENVFRVAYYDTYPDNTNYNGFFGAWGTYPYLSSGNIIVSDMVYGLFVLELDIQFLPVDLVQFDAQKVKDGIQINWSAENENTLNYYELQRLNGNQIQVLESFTKEAFHRNKGSYQFVDKNPSDGVNYYRLNTVDQDGTATLSKIISQRWNHEFRGNYRVYPNIFSNQNESTVYIETEKENAGPTTFRLIDLNGNLVWQQQQFLEEGDANSLVLPTQLPSGTYILNILNESTASFDQHRIVIR